jgi:hypothetical protein
MSWYKKANKLKVSTPEELLKWMDSIEYGWMDEDYKKREDLGNEFWNHYSMLLPHEVFKYKTGTCWDQTVFAKHVFDKAFDYESHMVFIQQYKVSTHTFLVYKKDDEWYWFENAFAKHRGIHGPFDSIEDIVVEVFEKMEEEEHGSGYEWTIMHPDSFKEKLTCKEFMDLCDYNYEEMEETDKESSFKEPFKR